MSDHSPSNACPKCGAALPSAATSGLCPRCLMAEAMLPTQADAPTAAAKMLTPAELAPHFPQLEILECLGRGGMGVVYKARQKTLNRFVALKLLAPERVTDAKFAERFTHEAQALAALNHPSIVTIYDFGQAGGFYYLLMEFVDGVNLRQAMKAGRFTPEQALAVVPPVCEALQYAHEHGIVHRDIKPENLLLDKEGRVKIADFGIAKMIGLDADTPARDEGPQAGTLASLAGTPQYMAPEQKAHRATDHRADIYSLGVVLYELLTGELPADKLQPPSRKVQIDVRLDEIVLRALEAQPERRYQTAGEFRTQVVTMTATAGAASIPPAAAAEPDVAMIEPRFSTAAIIGAAWMPFAVGATIFWASLGTPFYQFNLGAALAIFVSLSGYFGSTVLGWVAVSQIRRSAGRVHGMWLAVFDGLLFPLLALDALICWAWTGVVGAILRSLFQHSQASLPVSDPDQHLVQLLQAEQHIRQNMIIFGLLASVVTWVLVDFFIIRRVWRAVNRTAGNSTAAVPRAPGESGTAPLAGVAISFAVASGILGSIAWVLLRQKSQLPGGFAVTILICALLGVVTGFAAWRHRLGKMAATIGFINAAIWIFCTVFAPLIEELSPTQARAAIEQALKQEITRHLSASSERAASLSVALDPNLKTAAVSIGGLQEMRGVEGTNVWVDVDGSLSVLNDGGDWIVQGDGALGFIKFTVPLEDLTHTAQAYSDSLTEKRSRTPKSVHVTRNGGTVLVHHDDVDLHYVIFAPKAVGTAVSDQYNTDSLAWRDHGSFKLTEQQTFGYDRESADPFHLQINGKEYDLRRGRVLVPHDDGSVEQLKLFPPLATAKNPDELVKLIPPVRTMNEEPVTVEKSRWQLQASEAQLHDVLKTCAPTHPFVVEVREVITALKKKIAEQGGEATASATFGPVIERELAIPAENSLPPVWLDLDSGKEISTAGFTGDLDQPGAFPKWLKQQGADLASGRFATAETFREKDRSPLDKGTPFYEHGLYAWSGIGLNAMAVKPELWDSADATALLAMNTALAAMADSGFQKLIPERQSPQNLKGKLPATFLFKTAEGHMGLIQIVDFTKEMRSVKVRYKLVKAAVSGAAIPADTQRSVLEAELGQARVVAAQQEASFKAGTLDGVELQKAKDKVEILEARLTGDAVRVAEARLVAARRQWELASARHQAGLLSHAELETAKGEVLIAEAGLREATAKVPVTPAVTAPPTFGPVLERVLPSGEPCREQLFQFRSGQIFIVGSGPGTSPDEAAFDQKRIDDAGGVDMSASSGEQGVQIIGRGCFFTRDVEDLKWDTFTAEQAVEAVKNVSFVEGVVLPKKGEFPITYLFKTARGEVGIMEVLGPVEVKHEDWSDRGMKFRYKLVQGTGTTTIAPSKISLPQLNFGKETQGLQAALAVTPGEPFGLRLYLRNVSDKAIALDAANYRQEDECLLTDADGKFVPITRVTHDIKVGMGGGYHGPGQVAIFESAGLSFQSLDKVPSSAGYVAQAKPGRYTLRMKLRLPGDDVPFAPNQGVWHGELDTGPVTIEVKDPATQKVAPVADAVWSSHLGNPVEITVNDLQTTHENCALSLDTGKLIPVPGNITFDALSQNKMTKEPAPSVAEAWVRAQEEALTWARNNQVDAVAFVTTKDGKVVKCGLLCPDLLVSRVENKARTPNLADARMLKEHFEKAMQEWNFIPQIASVTSDGEFPETYLILDTRTHRRGVLQILGTSDQPRGVKISYRPIEGAAVKKITPAALPAAPKPAANR